MKLCLDTNVVIALMQGLKPHYRQRYDEALTAGSSLHLSAVVLHELIYGARRSARPQHHLALVEEITAGMIPEPWTLEDAIETAEIRSHLASVGGKIGLFDSQLAGQARQQEWVVVTANLKDFARVDGLRLIDWSDPNGPREWIGGVAHFMQRFKRD